MTARAAARHLAGLVLFWATATGAGAIDAIWQWSVPFGDGRAFLWIPEDCREVRGLVLAQNNMIEPGILGHATMRKTLAALGFAEVFVSPSVDPVYRFDAGARERFDGLLRALADESGYAELATAPIAPMGHSAHASFPWNFAAANPDRTLAVLSVKGDAPQTNLTGSGRPNPDWGSRRLDGIPGLMVMSEYEWWEDRLTPLLQFREAHPATPLAVLADAGHGHFDATDELVEYLAMFLRKAAAARLPAGGTGPLRPVDPAQGWAKTRWRPGVRTDFQVAPAAQFRGEARDAFWCFDEEMARATVDYESKGMGRKIQQVDFVQANTLSEISTTHTGIELRFLPEADGLSFRLTGDFITPLPPKPPVAAKDTPPPPTTVRPTKAAPNTHADGAVRISVITGAVEQLGPDRFRVALNRYYPRTDKRGWDLWFFAHHPGDAEYKGAVQQALLTLPRWTEGPKQTITFPPIANQALGTATVGLAATSDAGVPVEYFVREGPAWIRDGVLHLAPLPPRTRFPVKVTVVAWQFGRGIEPKLPAAEPVEQTFWVTAQ